MKMPEVDFIEANSVVYTTDTQQVGVHLILW
jgi:hypothetical protein